MANRHQHVVPHPRGWAVRGEGSQRATSVHPMQSDAIPHRSQNRDQQPLEMFIHRPDVRIRDRNSYGNDPNPPKG